MLMVGTPSVLKNAKSHSAKAASQGSSGAGVLSILAAECAGSAEARATIAAKIAKNENVDMLFGGFEVEGEGSIGGWVRLGEVGKDEVKIM